VKKKQLLLFALTVSLFSIVTGVTYAETEEPAAATQALGYVVAFSTFIVSGVFYAASGWIKKVRRKLVDDTVTLDYKKMRKAVLIGVILGLGAFIYSTYTGETINVTTPQEFFVQVGINTAIILLVDKWILGRVENGTPAEDDAPSEEDIPEEVPPGKDS